MFEGTDARRVTVGNLRRVTAFTSVSGVLMQGSSDLTTTYVTGSPTALGGNSMRTALIGNGIVAGEYVYYLTGTYDGGKVTSWSLDVLVQSRVQANWFNQSMWKESYIPYIGDITLYGNDSNSYTVNIPLTDFTAVTGALWQTSDVTSTYCSGSVSFSGNTLSTHVIGGNAPLDPGTYYYYLTGTYKDGNIATWFWRVTSLPRYGPQ